MKLSSKYLFFLLAAFLNISPVYTDSYSKEIFTLKVKDNSKVYTVEGSTVDIEMQYFKGTAIGEYYNGETNKFSSVVLKKFKDGHTESRARYILKGKSKTSQCDVFIEDNGNYKEGGSIITKPTIVTNCQDLAWLQTADIQGRVNNKGNTITVQFMWNESNTNKMPYPTVKMPDTTKTYNKEVFTFDISVGEFAGVNGADNAMSMMIGFTCASNTQYFKAKGVDTFVDTRMQFKGQVQTLSARYILEGQDDEGRATKVYIENSGIDTGTMTTEPFIVTDNPKWAWIETAPLHGTASMNAGFQIHLWTVNDPSLWEK